MHHINDFKIFVIINDNYFYTFNTNFDKKRNGVLKYLQPEN